MMKHQPPIAIALSPPPTRAQWETRDPVWYETKRLTSWVPMEKLDLAADVVLGVWDKDVGYDPDFVGTVRLPMQDLTRKGDDGELLDDFAHEAAVRLPPLSQRKRLQCGRFALKGPDKTC